MKIKISEKKQKKLPEIKICYWDFCENEIFLSIKFSDKKGLKCILKSVQHILI